MSILFLFSEFYEAKNIDKYDSLDEYLTFLVEYHLLFL